MKYPVSRLDKLLGNLGYGTRREVQAMVTRDQVMLDGEIIDFPDQRVFLNPNLPTRMTVAGEPLDPLPGMVIMLHKPVGVTCSHRKEEAPLVNGLLPPRWRMRDPALSTVGRLDKDTSGLLLLTDDGKLLHSIISPKSNIPKRYHVTLDRPIEGHEARVLGAGTLMLESEEKPLLPVDMEQLSTTQAYVTLHEGRYHQVRRMFAALGNHVTALHRDRIGVLDLPGDLAAGHYRLMSEKDIQQVLPDYITRS
jgi:16S rRNA pseudouridine516 synthase